MAGNPKVLIGEINGVELEFNEEYCLESEDIFYVLGDTVTVKDKLDELEFGFGYSVKFIASDEVFTVPENKAHLTKGIIVNEGIINNCGLMVIL